MELKVEELPIPGKIYHGTHSACWETIVSSSLIPGGARTGRLMNHFSIFPAGDPRNKAGTREEAQVVIEYDAAGIHEWAKARGLKHKLYMLHNGCVVTQLSVPWQYAMRAFERKTKHNLWRNPRYFKESNKMPLQPQQEVEVYRPPPRELILKGTKGDLDRWNAQFPEHFRRETEAARSRYIKTYGNDEYFTPPYSPPQHLVEEVRAERMKQTSRPAAAQQAPPHREVIAIPEATESEESFSTDPVIKQLTPRSVWKRRAELIPRSDSPPPLRRRAYLSTSRSSRDPDRDDADDKASEVAQQIFEERDLEKIYCSNPNCGEIHIAGTLVCDKCNCVLDETPDWEADDPVLAGQFHYNLPGENAVIDQLLETGDVSVTVHESGFIQAAPTAVAKASNVIRVQEAAQQIARHRVELVRNRRETSEQWFWDYKNRTWVDKYQAARMTSTMHGGKQRSGVKRTSHVGSWRGRKTTSPHASREMKSTFTSAYSETQSRSSLS